MRITKTKFLFIFLLLLFYQSFSQSLTYEVFGGVNISNLKSSVNHKGSRLRVSLDSRTAYFFGGSIEFPMNIVKGYNFLLNIQLQYSLQGSSFYFMHDAGRQYDKVNQINLPIRIKFELLNNFFIGAGGYIGTWFTWTIICMKMKIIIVILTQVLQLQFNIKYLKN